jgi:hypothetical protein
VANLPRQTILRPVGLVTQPNKFGWYVDGALSRAINCVMRNPGELDAAPDFFAGTGVGPADNVLHKLMPLDAGHVYSMSSSAGNVWQVREGVVGASNIVSLNSFTSTTNTFSSTGRISPARARDRMLLNSNYGYLVGDFMAPTTVGERALRLAGLPQLTYANTTPTSTDAGAIPNNMMCTYVAIHTRKYADGYELKSVPTPFVKFLNTSGSAVNVTVALAWNNADVALVGDVIELYRSDGVAATTYATESSTTCKLVASKTLAASDIAAATVGLLDKSKMGDAPYFQTTGRELYCNPGQGGLTTINRQPPLAAVTAVFDGRVFYLNTTDRPKMTVQVPAGIGNAQINVAQQTDYWRTNGIGGRSGAGTVTNGSPTITGVSAAEMKGVVPGQRWAGGIQFSPSTAFVVSTTATSFTMNANAVGGAAVWGLADAMYIGFNGGALGAYKILGMADLLLSLAGQGAVIAPGNLFEITSNLSFPSNSNGAGAYSPGVSLSIEPRNHGAQFQTMQVTATNGQNYSPPLAEYNTTATNFARTTLKNRMTWSKDQQGEHVPPGGAQVNETFVGLRECIAAASTREALWIACLDGIFRLSGIGGQYRLDQVDSTKIICAPQAMCALDEDVFVYTNFGMLRMSSEARDNLTDETIGDLLPGPQYAEVPTMQLVGNETDLEIVYLDASNANRLWIRQLREGGGWTTLENGGVPLQFMTALAFQRSPASGEPRVLVGTSGLFGTAPVYRGWGNTASFLTMDIAFQPIYADDPMSLKRWIEASYLFDVSNAGKTLRPVWNGTPIGSAGVVQYQNAAYARAGVPRVHADAQSIAAGCDSVSGAAPQARFLGISLMFKPLTTQAKQRT